MMLAFGVVWWLSQCVRKRAISHARQVFKKSEKKVLSQYCNNYRSNKKRRKVNSCIQLYFEHHARINQKISRNRGKF